MIEEHLAHPSPIGLADSKTSLPEALFKYSFGRPGYLVQAIQEAYRILGVYDPGFNDFSRISLTGAVIKRAFNNILGDLTDRERKDMWKDSDKKEDE
ncbi:hypothetical protein [Brevibacillus laterosporus]|uniref:hypothetical protein n=1 Tax=Brevibacillus laterosporus TaxID=1465 RepID=UPI0011400E53|nr:hypothetical protein [Brevibacillus laterosporus]